MQAGKSIQVSELQMNNSQNPYPCYGGNGIRGYLSQYNHDGSYPIIGRQGALCGNINIAKGKFYATEHAIVVNYFANTNVMLWVLFLENLNLNRYATATAQPGLSVTKIEEVPIPIPPLQEQMRIVEAVQNWMECFRKLSESSTQLCESVKFAKSKILDLAMQGKLVSQDPTDEPAADMLRRINPKAKIITDTQHYKTLPKLWISCTLGSVANIKSAKRIMKDDWKNDGIPFYRTREIIKLSKDGYVDNQLYISHELYDSYKEKYGVPKTGDIMLTAVGTIGETYIVNKSDLFYYKDASVLCVQPINNLLDSAYFCLFIRSNFAQRQIHNQSKGTTVDTITIEKANNYTFILPPLKEQKRLVTEVRKLYSILDEIEASLQT